jgi:hypothetical protein
MEARNKQRDLAPNQYFARDRTYSPLPRTKSIDDEVPKDVEFLAAKRWVGKSIF